MFTHVIDAGGAPVPVEWSRPAKRLKGTFESALFELVRFIRI